MPFYTKLRSMQAPRRKRTAKRLLALREMMDKGFGEPGKKAIARPFRNARCKTISL